MGKSRTRFKMLIALAVAICGTLFWLVENRSFYEIAPGRFITVWRAPGNKCFVIPGKYLWPTYPKTSHVLTTNSSQACGMVLNATADTLFYEERGTSFSIHNADPSSVFISDWNSDGERLDSLYTVAGKTFRPDVAYLTLSIHDGYALYANPPR